jgi:hypothetical protein
MLIAVFTPFKKQTLAPGRAWLDEPFCIGPALPLSSHRRSRKSGLLLAIISEI